jgi:hypothetical protein
MKKIGIVLVVVIISLSCNKKLENTDISDVNEDSQVVNSINSDIVEIPESCYFDDLKNDSIYLHINNNIGTITGKLRYKNGKKEKTTGDVMGFIDGDTLKLDYMFTENGVQTSKEIWFLNKNEKLVEGIGNHDEFGSYSNPKKIVFEGGHSLESANCKGFDKNFK